MLATLPLERHRLQARSSCAPTSSFALDFSSMGSLWTVGQQLTPTVLRVIASTCAVVRVWVGVWVWVCECVWMCGCGCAVMHAGAHARTHTHSLDLRLREQGVLHPRLIKGEGALSNALVTVA